MMADMYPDASPATSGTSGTIKLAGDLGGTADSPSVVKVAGQTPGTTGLAVLVATTQAAGRTALGLGTAATSAVGDFDAAGAAAAAATAAAPLTTKGDALGYSTVPVRVAVGNNAESLQAWSTATPGVAYAPAGAAFVWQGFIASGSATAFYPLGTTSFTTTGTNPAQVNAEGLYARATTGATSGNSATWLSPPSFAPLMSTSAYRYLHFEVQLAAVTHARIWIGLFGTTPTSVDTIGTQCLGFRYSTVAGDAGFVPVTCDGAGNQTVGTAITGNATGTTYHLWARIRTGSFEVATSPYGPWTAQNTNLPTASTALVLGDYIATTAAGSQTYDRRLMLHGESTL